MESNRLRYYRNKSNLKQSDIAEEIGVKKSRITKWEAGVEKIDQCYQKELAKIFGVSVRQLMGRARKDKKIYFVRCNERYEEVYSVLFVISFFLFIVGAAILNAWMKSYNNILEFLNVTENIEAKIYSSNILSMINENVIFCVIVFGISVALLLISIFLKHIKINRKGNRD